MAQTPTIEELEKRIEDAKKDHAAKEQAQESAKRQPDPQGAVALKQGTLMLENDAPCTLSIDTKRVGDTLPAGARELAVARGERVIECTSADEPTVSVSQTVRVKPGAKTLVQLQLKDQVAAAADKRRKAGPFDELADGLLRDHRTGLVWSASDNGRDVNWADAAHYCNDHGMQLPTVGQLQRLVDRSGAMTTQCQGRQCKVSDRFHLTGYGYWSRQREGERWAVFVTLDNGRRSFDFVGIRNNFRALCVRGA